ncbi:MAG: hypothetical protein WC444_02005 [Candidatus Paceibacterota bacterium]
MKAFKAIFQIGINGLFVFLFYKWVIEPLWQFSPRLTVLFALATLFVFLLATKEDESPHNDNARAGQ